MYLVTDENAKRRVKATPVFRGRCRLGGRGCEEKRRKQVEANSVVRRSGFSTPIV